MFIIVEIEELWHCLDFIGIVLSCFKRIFNHKTAKKKTSNSANQFQSPSCTKKLLESLQFELPKWQTIANNHKTSAKASKCPSQLRNEPQTATTSDVSHMVLEADMNRRRFLPSIYKAFSWRYTWPNSFRFICLIFRVLAESAQRWGD